VRWSKLPGSMIPSSQTKHKLKEKLLRGRH
jgi:hypothetical protein